MIEAVSHITFVVKDLERTAGFLRHLFDAEEIYDSRDRKFSISHEKFFLVGGTWVAIMEGEPLPERTYNHVAFKVPDSEFDAYVSRVERLGLETLPGRERVKEEGRSIYFYDYDNHLFEIHSGGLKERLSRYRKG